MRQGIGSSFSDLDSLRLFIKIKLIALLKNLALRIRFDECIREIPCAEFKPSCFKVDVYIVLGKIISEFIFFRMNL